MKNIDADDLNLSPDQLDNKYNQEGDGEHPNFPRHLWRHEVVEMNTISGYWVWVHHQLGELEDEEDE